MARKRKTHGNRGKLTCVDKDNLFNEAAERYPDVETSYNYVDAQVLDLVRKPWEYDVMVMENMFGDILSDLAGGLVGGMGMAACAEIGDEIWPVSTRSR